MCRQRKSERIQVPNERDRERERERERRETIQDNLLVGRKLKATEKSKKSITKTKETTHTHRPARIKSRARKRNKSG